MVSTTVFNVKTNERKLHALVHTHPNVYDFASKRSKTAELEFAGKRRRSNTWRPTLIVAMAEMRLLLCHCLRKRLRQSSASFLLSYFYRLASRSRVFCKPSPPNSQHFPMPS